MPGRSLRRALTVLAAVGTVVAMSSTAAMASPRAVSHHVQTAISIGDHGGMRPMASAGCTGDACITLGTPYKNSGNWYVQVHGCAWQTAVYGYIHIFGPNGVHSNSKTKTWHATSSYCTGSDDAYVATFKNPPTGNYCSETISGGVNDGVACETLDSYK